MTCQIMQIFESLVSSFNAMAPPVNDIVRQAAPVAVAIGGVAAIPVTLSVLGFGAGGIAAGSAAAKGMSVAATSGYGMFLISACQSIGAAGLALGTKAALGGASYLTAWYVGRS